MDTATSRNNCSSDTTLTQKPETLKKLKFAQANLGRGYAAQKEIIREALHQELNLLMIQEPVGALAYVNIKYRVIQKLNHDVQKPVKSAVFVVDGSLQVIEYPDLVEENIVAFKINIEDRIIGIINVYLKKEVDIEEDLSKINRIMDALNTPDIILGRNINAKSPW